MLLLLILLKSQTWMPKKRKLFDLARIKICLLVDVDLARIKTIRCMTYLLAEVGLARIKLTHFIPLACLQAWFKNVLLAVNFQSTFRRISKPVVKFAFVATSTSSATRP